MRQRSSNFVDLSGRKFGRLRVKDRLPPKSGNNRGVVWLCECDCGNSCEVVSWNLKAGYTASCGCLKKDQDRRNLDQTTHGANRTKAYNSWRAMKDRCSQPTHNRWKHYGGRGIKVCDEWAADFRNFLRDMGLPPTTKHSIDRIDPNGHYEKANCRWATSLEQTRNRRKPTDGLEHHPERERRL